MLRAMMLVMCMVITSCLLVAAVPATPSPSVGLVALPVTGANTLGAAVPATMMTTSPPMAASAASGGTGESGDPLLVAGGVMSSLADTSMAEVAYALNGETGEATTISSSVAIETSGTSAAMKDLLASLSATAGADAKIEEYTARSVSQTT